MDRQLIREMVEDYWRAAIPAMQRQDHAAANEIGERFERRIAETAAKLDPVQGAAFQQAVDAERDALIDEYKRDPATLKRRLGVALGVDAAQPRITYGTVLADTAARTVVRATIWEIIWRLFR